MEERNDSSSSTTTTTTIIDSDPDSITCTHCSREIPRGNYELHYAHCSRNLRKCPLCCLMVPLSDFDSQRHFSTAHAPSADDLLPCPFCDFPLPASDPPHHQDVCGNRTQLCHLCHKYVRLNQFHNHQLTQCNTPPISRDSFEEPQRDEPQPRPPPRRQPPPPPPFLPGKVLVTIAITGIALLLGSLFFQRKSHNNQPPPPP